MQTVSCLPLNLCRAWLGSLLGWQALREGCGQHGTEEKTLRATWKCTVFEARETEQREE